MTITELLEESKRILEEAPVLDAYIAEVLERSNQLRLQIMLELTEPPTRTKQ